MPTPLRSVAMNESVPSLRSETLALDALIKEAVARAEACAKGGPADTMLFLGNRHQSFPSAVIKDPVLEPVDKLVWMVVTLAVRDTGGPTAFPGYDDIGRLANIASRSTIARAIAILRATRWLTLCARVRNASGQFRGNLYALHDEPLPLGDSLHLDADYMAFLRRALSHGHARVRVVAQGVLDTIDESIEAGENICAHENPIERRLQRLVRTEPGGIRRFFTFSEKIVKRLRSDLTRRGEGTHHHDQNSNSVLCSCSYTNKTTTTQVSDPSKFRLTGENGRPLIYPRRLLDNQRALADRYLRTLAPEQRQPILDELEGRFRSEQKGMRPVYDEIRFLHALCNAARNGKFRPNLGLKVCHGRLEREHAGQSPREAKATKPAKETDEQRQQRMASGRAHVAELRESLGMQKTSEPRALYTGS